MPKYKEKKLTGLSVYEAALERVRYLYKRFDHVCVSFSGGKDSTATLHVCIEVARELGKLPVHAIFVDEEVLPPTTVAYVERVRAMPEVQLDWYCLPVKHRNACSLDSPYWTCWDASQRDKWVRQPPPWAICEHPELEKGMEYQTWMGRLFPNERGAVCILLGIRADESLRRMQMIMNKKNDAFVKIRAENQNTYRAFPIYDWRSSDVWRLVMEKGYDYNRTYDLMNKTKLHNSLNRQRVCQPFGEEPLRSLWMWSECWPELWPKVLARVPGVATAWRYANTELYLLNTKPAELSWQDYAMLLAGQYTDEGSRTKVEATIRKVMARHYKETDDPIADEKDHPLTGVSWRLIAKLAGMGDFKGRKVGKIAERRRVAQAKLGITKEEAKRRYGRAAN
jgi:predicted phosphoadenosine phosphosulfate sulfurtransferase